MCSACTRREATYDRVCVIRVLRVSMRKKGATRGRVCAGREANFEMAVRRIAFASNRNEPFSTLNNTVS